MCGTISKCFFCDVEQQNFWDDISLKMNFYKNDQEYHICSQCIISKLKKKDGNDVFETLLNSKILSEKDIIEYYADEDRYKQFKFDLENEYRIQMAIPNEFLNISNDETIEKILKYNEKGYLSISEVLKIVFSNQQYDCVKLVELLTKNKSKVDNVIFQFACKNNWEKSIEYFIKKYNLSRSHFSIPIIDIKIREYRKKIYSINKEQ